MKLNKSNAEIFIPDGKPISEALSRTTMMAISAHQDDIEIMACDGIIKCFANNNEWFTGVVVTNGGGSTRTGIYSSYSDEEIKKVRRLEQKKAAFVGEYSAQFLLNYSSDEVKDPNNIAIISELKDIIINTSPTVIYTHNLADKHGTHLATVIKVIRAIRELPYEVRPKKVFGCEVWRDLDWLSEKYRVVFDVSTHENITTSMLGVFDSQIMGGKRYDLAVLGRRRANATFNVFQGIDTTTAISYAMDLSPLVKETNLDIIDFIMSYIELFLIEVKENIIKYI